MEDSRKRAREEEEGQSGGRARGGAECRHEGDEKQQPQAQRRRAGGASVSVAWDALGAFEDDEDSGEDTGGEEAR